MTKAKTLVQPIKWHGGKHYLQKHIHRLAEGVKYKHRIITHAGGLGEFWNWEYEGISEVVNDISGELTNFWSILAHPTLFARMERVLQATPFSRGRFDLAQLKYAKHKELWGDRIPTGIERVSRAIDFFVVARQSRQGLLKDFATLSRNRTRRGMNEQVSSWLTAIDGLPDVHARLKRVVILNRDAVDVIKQQDGPNTLFYCDPPYLHETRTTTKAYQHEMDPSEHERLLATLAMIKGKFILSGYRSERYDEWAADRGWCRQDIELDNKSSSAKVKEIKTECLWYNF